MSAPRLRGGFWSNRHQGQRLVIPRKPEKCQFPYMKQPFIKVGSHFIRRSSLPAQCRAFSKRQMP